MCNLPFASLVASLSAIIAFLALLLGVYNAFRIKSPARRASIYCNFEKDTSKNGFSLPFIAEEAYEIYSQIWRIRNIQCFPYYYFIILRNDGDVNLYNISLDVAFSVPRVEISSQIFIEKTKRKYSKLLIQKLEPGEEKQYIVLNVGSFPACKISCKIKTDRNDKKLNPHCNRKIKINHTNSEITKHQVDTQLSIMNPSLSIFHPNEE
jgi:hypothetical protein